MACSLLTTAPVVEHGVQQKSVKGEDLVVVARDNHFRTAKQVRRMSTFNLFCVFDGHGGVDCADHCANTILETLTRYLPRRPAPPGGMELEEWLEDINVAVAYTFLALTEAFACEGVYSGCTATVVVQAGWYLTIGAVGDSLAILDCGSGSEVIRLTDDHRVDSNAKEQRRLSALGRHLAKMSRTGGPASAGEAGLGPLRIWPGGLCVSRAIGDQDVGAGLTAMPHISQVQMPTCGCRLIAASDGLWDCVRNVSSAAIWARGLRAEAAATTLVQKVMSLNGCLVDDTSVLVADFFLPSQSAIPGIHTSLGRASSCFALSGLFSCMSEKAVLSGSSGSDHDLLRCGDTLPPQEPPCSCHGEAHVMWRTDTVELVRGQAPGPGQRRWKDAGLHAEYLVEAEEEAFSLWQEASQHQHAGRKPPPRRQRSNLSQGCIAILKASEVQAFRSEPLPRAAEKPAERETKLPKSLGSGSDGGTVAAGSGSGFEAGQPRPTVRIRATAGCGGDLPPGLTQKPRLLADSPMDEVVAAARAAAEKSVRLSGSVDSLVACG